MNTLSNLRNQLDMTQAELANALGQTQGSIGHYETGRYQMPVAVAKRLINLAAANGINLSLDQIYAEVLPRQEVA